MPENKDSKVDLRRLTILAACLTFGLAVIVAQLIRFQVVQHSKYLAEMETQIRYRHEEPTTRGNIYDIKGRILAMDVFEWYVGLNPPLVTRPVQLANGLSTVLGFSARELYDKAVAEAQWVFVANHVPFEVGEYADSLGFSGLACDPQTTRVYPEGSATCHLIGIVNQTGNGFYGVEGYYNDSLKPTPGSRETEQGPDGAEMPIIPLAISPARPGTDLVLTLDLNIQHIVREELLRALKEYEAESGTVIVMEPTTGAILASVSYPSYDPNSFADADLDLLADPTVSRLWEPGSIFKIITWAAALDAGIITPETTFYDSGSLEVGGRVIRNWDRRAYGLVTMEDGLVKSLNTVAAYLSTSLGKNRFYTYVRRFGFGSLTGVDLASEGPGMVKLPGDSNWFPSELGTNSFGQGIAVTPIQMLAAVTPVANKGLLVQPRIVHQFITRDEVSGEERVIPNEPMIVRRAISEDAARTLTEMLVQVVERGATKAQIPGYRVAGKTGTAQVPVPYGYHETDTIASFIGYAPADEPQFLVLVKLDRPKASPWGSQTAAPTFRAIAERLLVYLQIPPDDGLVAQHSSAP